MENGETGNPLVSVIMPTYNGEEFIEEAISSIIRQTYQNWELIIIDDCSSDSTVDLIHKFDEPRIRFYQNAENRGIVYSTNFGISESKGEYIALLDDDDVALERRFEWQVKYLNEHKDVDVLGGSDAEIDEKGNLIKYGGSPLHNPKLIKAYLLFYKNMFTDCTVMYRKKFIDKYQIRYKENTFGMHDLKFYMDCSKVGTITAIDQLLIYKRIYDTQETMMQIKKNPKQRADKFAQMQRESIAESGFILSEEHLKAINENIPELMRPEYSMEDLKRLYKAFQEMVVQAREMQVDYLDELEFACKKILGTRVMTHVDIFDDSIQIQEV